ncbi:hypothetical protein B0H17DRAFT_1147200 [Mycena rosella]|uniref:Uncharacterized protein n=1 Tax=Mycena rosella TaxID=1033263 RepID=A0AAD7G2M9_MYCRO|nr:hypothetical protein B0H17DRAFT_1147200 [Mycena rosella]
MYIARVVQDVPHGTYGRKIEVGASLDQEKADKAARDAKSSPAMQMFRWPTPRTPFGMRLKLKFSSPIPCIPHLCRCSDAASRSDPSNQELRAARTGEGLQVRTGPGQTPEAVERHRFELQAKRRRIFFEIEGEAPQRRRNSQEGSRAEAGKDKHGGGKGKGRGKGKDKAKAPEPDTDSD